MLEVNFQSLPNSFENLCQRPINNNNNSIPQPNNAKKNESSRLLKFTRTRSYKCQNSLKSNNKTNTTDQSSKAENSSSQNIFKGRFSSFREETVSSKKSLNSLLSNNSTNANKTSIKNAVELVPFQTDLPRKEKYLSNEEATTFNEPNVIKLVGNSLTTTFIETEKSLDFDNCLQIKNNKRYSFTQRKPINKLSLKLFGGNGEAQNEKNNSDKKSSKLIPSLVVVDSFSSNPPNCPLTPTRMNSNLYEMPSLIELNEANATPSNSVSYAKLSNIEDEGNLNIGASDLSLNSPEPNSALLNNNANTTANILVSLEYLINQSKSSNLNFNTKLAIANIAAVLNNNPSNESFLGDRDSSNDNLLKTLLMDLMAPPAATSQFDLNSTASNEQLDLSVINPNLNEFSLVNNNNRLNAPGIFNINGSNAGLPGATSIGCTSVNEKQINEQIMRTCMGYLENVNDKHNKDRRIQKMRNKISGFVFLTLVFLLIIGLGLIMFIFLTTSLTRIFQKSVPSAQILNKASSNKLQNSIINENNTTNLRILDEINEIFRKNLHKFLNSLHADLKFKSSYPDNLEKEVIKFKGIERILSSINTHLFGGLVNLYDLGLICPSKPLAMNKTESLNKEL
jgi:hypothetical protein